MTEEQKEIRLKKLLENPPNFYKQIDASIVKDVERMTIRNNKDSFDWDDNRIINNEKFQAWQPKRKRKK